MRAALEIRDAGGTVLLEHAWTARYEVSYPNGERCGPRCVRETVTLQP